MLATMENTVFILQRIIFQGINKTVSLWGRYTFSLIETSSFDSS